MIGVRRNYCLKKNKAKYIINIKNELEHHNFTDFNLFEFPTTLMLESAMAISATTDFLPIFYNLECNSIMASSFYLYFLSRIFLYSSGSSISKSLKSSPSLIFLPSGANLIS